MITVFTYFWTDEGNDKYTKYTPNDVRDLKERIKLNTTVDYRFAVVTDVPDKFENDYDIYAVTMDKSKHVPGTCFSRLWTFSEDAKIVLGERVFQLDLDTLVLGNIDSVITREEPTVLWRNPCRVPWDNPSKPSRPFYNTSFVLTSPGVNAFLWTEFNDKVVQEHRDDQWWISERLGADMPYWDAMDGVYRLERENTPGSGVGQVLPSNVKFITFAGSEGKFTNPKVQEKYPWVKQFIGL